MTEPARDYFDASKMTEAESLAQAAHEPPKAPIEHPAVSVVHLMATVWGVVFALAALGGLVAFLLKP